MPTTIPEHDPNYNPFSDLTPRDHFAMGVLCGVLAALLVVGLWLNL